VTNRYYDLYLQQPKVKHVGKGLLNIEQNGTASFYDSPEANAHFLAELKRVRIDFAGAAGIMLDGFESVGADAQQREKFRFQQWWLMYTEPPT
jgi:hypothetical protein